MIKGLKATNQEHEAVEAVSESSTGQSTTASGAVDNSNLQWVVQPGEPCLALSLNMSTIDDLEEGPAWLGLRIWTHSQVDPHRCLLRSMKIETCQAKRPPPRCGIV